MARLIRISDTKAYRISIIRMASAKGEPKNPKMLSIRQMYATTKEPGEWKPGYAGITLSFDICSRIIKAMISVFKDPDMKVEVIEPKEKSKKSKSRK